MGWMLEQRRVDCLTVCHFAIQSNRCQWDAKTAAGVQRFAGVVEAGDGLILCEELRGRRWAATQLVVLWLCFLQNQRY
jgi:hypothetical protein